MKNSRTLFDRSFPLPSGFVYQPEFINEEEERALLHSIEILPLAEAQYRQYTAKRRIMSYGGRYDFSNRELLPASPIPVFLHPLRARIAGFAQIDEADIAHAVITEYKPGTQLGWHRDVPDIEVVTGVSLAGSCRMRLRPYPPRRGRNPDVLVVQLEQRSAYIIRGDARWRWQHSIPPTPTLRYSITFRTRRRKER